MDNHPLDRIFTEYDDFLLFKVTWIAHPEFPCMRVSSTYATCSPSDSTMGFQVKFLPIIFFPQTKLCGLLPRGFDMHQQVPTRKDCFCNVKDTLLKYTSGELL